MRLPPVDERIVAPESRAEILEGRLVFAPPAEEKQAVPHADLAYVLRAHVKPDVYEAARDEETGGRHES